MRLRSSLMPLRGRGSPLGRAVSPEAAGSIPALASTSATVVPSSRAEPSAVRSWSRWNHRVWVGIWERASSSTFWSTSRNAWPPCSWMTCSATVAP